MIQPRRTAKEVMSGVAAQHGLQFSDLLSVRRHRKLSHIRFEAIYKAYVHCPHMSMPAIGRALGGRDHTSILHAIRRYCEMNDIDYDLVRRRFPVPYVMPTVPVTASDYRERVRIAA